MQSMLDWGFLRGGDGSFDHDGAGADRPEISISRTDCGNLRAVQQGIW
jgi:hypothetical protein